MTRFANIEDANRARYDTVIGLPNRLGSRSRDIVLFQVHAEPRLARFGAHRGFSCSRVLVSVELAAAALYTGPLWAYVVDYLWFGIAPTLSSIAGGALVVGAGIYLVLIDQPARPASIDAE